MLSYDVKTLVNNLVRELRPYDNMRQRFLVRAILSELGEELGEYIIQFFEEEARDLRRNII